MIQLIMNWIWLARHLCVVYKRIQCTNLLKDLAFKEVQAIRDAEAWQHGLVNFKQNPIFIHKRLKYFNKYRSLDQDFFPKT